MARQVALRTAGSAVAAIVLMAATQWLLHGLDTAPLVSRARVEDVARWVKGPHHAAVEVLVGIGLFAMAGWLGWSLWTTRILGRPAVTTRRDGGWTKLDRPTLVHTIERALDPIDRHSELAVRVTRRGRVDLRVVTPDRIAVGPIQHYRQVLDDLVQRRSLPVSSGRVVARARRRLRPRGRVR